MSYARLRNRTWKEKFGDSNVGICWICQKELKKKDATLDHILEKCRGGTNKKENLNLAHWLCNHNRSKPIRLLKFKNGKPLRRRDQYYYMFQHTFAQHFAPDLD